MRNLRIPGLVAVCLAGLMVAGCGDDDGKFESGGTPELEIRPDVFNYSKIVIGEDDDAIVDVQNVGDLEIIIDSVDVDMSSPSEFSLYYTNGSGAETLLWDAGTRNGEVSYPIIIEVADTLSFRLHYSPSDDVQDRGTISIQTNVAADPFEIPVRTANPTPEIQVSPGAIDFDRVEAGEVATQTVNITNIGTLPLDIRQIGLSGSRDFVPLLNNTDPRRAPSVLEDPDGDGEGGLAPSASFQLTIQYTPTSEGGDVGQLSILSNDPERPEVAVQLTANGAIPCLDVVPAAVEFRTSLLNRTDSRAFALESCGSQSLEIISIEVDPESDEAFELDTGVFDESFPDGLPVLLPQVGEDGSRPSRTLRVNFSPVDERVYTGKIIVTTNDVFNPIREISLLGRGRANACPQSRTTQAEYFVNPLDVVTLDGSPSVDQDGPDGRPIRYEWVVLDRPEGSTSPVVERTFPDPAAGGEPDDGATPTSQFYVDVVGTYTLELRTTDNLGLTSQQCNTSSIVTIVAEPDQDILVQLTWDTPSDPDQTDSRGTDLDLHLLHPLADGWFSAPWDCHYNNSKPDWGQLDDPTDNPVLDIDDSNGAGPENINLNNPENTEQLGTPYLVGVHYYRSDDLLGEFEYGPSMASLRIFIRGELTWDFDGSTREMLAADHFWDAARIHWPEGRVVTSDRYFEQRP